jgi:myo-inositol-1-phosphate synthase
MNENPLVSEPAGKVGVLLVGLGGAVATTFTAGLMAVRKHLAQPVGSLTQMARISGDHHNGTTQPLVKDAVPLAELDDIVVGGWDIHDMDCLTSAAQAEVLTESDLAGVRHELQAIRPMKAVFDSRFVPRLHGSWIKSAPTKFDLMEALRSDIREFRRQHGLDRLVMIGCASTEIHAPEQVVHRDLPRLTAAMKANDPHISPAVLYAYAALAEKVPHVNCAPNRVTDLPALSEFARLQAVPVAGKDLKTGQTLVKTVIAPMLKARMLGLRGWFSTNLLGNQDGYVLDEPGAFKAKEESKLSSLERILQPALYPNLYGDVCHQVDIHYYPPRRDDKEAWDNVDLFGWMNYPMQLKVNFLCRDSILAAPLVLDLTLLMDLAARAGMAGIQDWLSFYFKSPLCSPGHAPVHDLFAQRQNLEDALVILSEMCPAAV